MTPRRVRILVPLIAVASILAACGGGDEGGAEAGSGDGQLTVWTVEDLADRVEAQKALMAQFTDKTGVEVELVAISEDQLTTVLTSAAAANDLPDVIGALSLGAVSRLRTDDLLDTDAAGEIVESLGEDTFTKSSLDLTRADDAQLAVPSDGWAQLLYYRKDLFDAAGLQPPTSYAAIEAAAQKLNTGDVAGIVAATMPADSFTHQTFEHVALANGCQLVNDDGDITLDSQECVQAMQFFANLIRNYSVAGNQDVDTTRATYFAGRAAMVIWSSFLLDELAGLRNDALPTCPQCTADSTFLAKNTGVVSALEGTKSGDGATFGEIVSWAVLQDASTEEAKQLVEFMMSDAYEQWLAIAPEGKVPTRTGTADNNDAYVTAWQSMPAGVDQKAPLANFYDTATLEQVVTSPQSFDRWGFAQGRGELAGAVAGQYVLPKALADLISSGGDASVAAKQAAEEAQTIKEDIGE
jgi:multiple sugar transport system substrate-binding protein